MTAKEAKDFLVQQTAEQAALESISISHVEKRMMYFVENDAASCPNPLELNEEFEAQYDTAEYETKIASLLHHAYIRLKSENPEKVRHWDQAIRTLSSGDHYLPVLWSTASAGERPLRGAFTPVRNSFTLFVTGLLIAAAIIVAGFVAWKYDISLDRSRDYLPVPRRGLGILLFLGLLMLGLAGWLFFDWVLLPWVRRRGKDDNQSS